MNTNSGFTLIELLMVIAIIGIVASIFAYTVYQGVQNTRLNEAASQVVVDLRLAREKARTTGVDSIVTLCATVVTPTTPCATTPTNKSAVYSLRYGNSSVIQRALPYGIVAANVTDTSIPATYVNSVTYSSPYAETQAPGLIWSLTDRRGIQRFVRITGVTGKVSFSASLN